MSFITKVIFYLYFLYIFYNYLKIFHYFKHMNSKEQNKNKIRKKEEMRK